jgi:hypothetical protein
MRFTAETGWQAKQKKQGKSRARFWRALGFPNLVLARQKKYENWLMRQPKWADSELPDLLTTDIPRLPEDDDGSP